MFFTVSEYNRSGFFIGFVHFAGVRSLQCALFNCGRFKPPAVKFNILPGGAGAEETRSLYCCFAGLI